MVCLTVDNWNVASVTDIEKGTGEGESTREDKPFISSATNLLSRLQ